MKRPWGTGTVTWEGDRWRARLPLRLGRREVPLPEGADEATAHAVLTAALELEAERPTVTRSVDDVVADWLDGREVRENTRRADRARWETYRDGLGERDAYGLSASEVEAWWAGVRRAHPTLAATTLSNLATVVRGAFPKLALDLSLPKRSKKLPDWLRPHEIVRVLGCQVVPLRSRLIYCIQIFCGFRPGELWGMHRDDVDLDRGVCAVRRSRNEATKTSAEREVSLLWPARVAFERALELSAGHRSGLVFPSEATGGCYADGYDAGWYDARSLFRLGRPFVFYSLRHTCASHLLQGTWAPEYVARPFRLEEVRDHLGHRDLATTQIYAHLCADSRHSLVRDCPGELPGPEATPENRTRDLRFTKAAAPSPVLRVIEGESAAAGSPLGSVADRVLETAFAGGEIALMDVLRLAIAVRDAEVKRSIAITRKSR